MAQPQIGVIQSDVCLIRAEPDRSLKRSDSGLRLSQVDQRCAELTQPRYVAIERGHRLQLDLRFVQSPLQPAKNSHSDAGGNVARINSENLEQKPFGARFVLLKRAAPAVPEIAGQTQSD